MAPRRCIYFFAELMKLGVALAWCFKAYRENDREVVKHFNVDRSDFLQYAVPGFVFFAQNNLSFLALQHMNSSAFQLLMNTRIVSVAILAVIMLNKRMHALEWTSIVLLMVGAMQYQLSGCGDDGYKIDTMGLCVMAVIVACAAVWKSTSELGSTEITSRRWRGAPEVRFPHRPAELVHTVTYDELVADTAGELDAIFRFLGVAPNVTVASSYVKTSKGNVLSNIENTKEVRNALRGTPWEVHG